MVPHYIRLIVIGVLCMVCLIGEIVLAALGKTDSTVFTAMTTALGILIPAVLDASWEQKVRSDAGTARASVPTLRPAPPPPPAA